MSLYLPRPVCLGSLPKPVKESDPRISGVSSLQVELLLVRRIPDVEIIDYGGRAIARRITELESGV
jgi:hypothetical protein